MEQATKGSNTNFPTYPLAELHAHLSASIDPAILWQIAHNLGFKLPYRTYQTFRKHVTLSSERSMPLNEYFEKVYHPLLNKLSSGTHAVREATYQTLSGASRNGISLIELRMNPMKHNFGAEIDLDHLIIAMIHGMERALLEHEDLRTGLIFCIAREFSYDQNAIIIEKAIKYHRRGVIGIDVAGPATAGFRPKAYQSLFARAKKAGLKVTVHSGEVRDANDMWDMLEFLQPERIGHGIHAAYDVPLMAELAKRNIVLEVCPLSNLATQAVKDIAEMRTILRTFVDHKVPFSINTDWPEIIAGCRLPNQYRMLLDQNILSEDELQQCTRTAFAASFTPVTPGLGAYL